MIYMLAFWIITLVFLSAYSLAGIFKRKNISRK